jgi:hypothetical protein
MLFKLKAQHADLCVLRIAPTVLDLPNVVIADRNASSDHVRFAPAPTGLSLIDDDEVFARSWKHPDDQIAEWRHRSIKCAEVLVPDHVDASYVVGAYVLGPAGIGQIRLLAPTLAVEVNSDIFFA